MMKEDKSWYAVTEADIIDSPCLLVYPDRVSWNIKTAIQMAGSADRLRPHVKTHKSPEVSRLMLEAGISRFKCSTIAEAEMLALCGAPDILLAYQPLGPKLDRFAKLIHQYPASNWSCLVDNLAAARHQSQVFASAGWRIPVYIDLNVGMNRTGIAPGSDALSLYTAIAGLPGIYVKGLHAYDGHIRDRDFAARKEACDAAFALVKATAASLEAISGQHCSIVAGGSPSFPIHAKREAVECSPGTFVYWDKGYLDLCPEQDFKPAAVLLTRVISHPAEGRICTDLGHKSVAAENEISRRIHFLNAENLQPISQSEEHLVLSTGEADKWQPGSLLYALPYHVCPTVALYERVLLIREGHLSGEWSNQARDRKINI
jgi:D-serine deaminase-like pyridoxal phosphate-dependent protein